MSADRERLRRACGLAGWVWPQATWPVETNDSARSAIEWADRIFHETDAHAFAPGAMRQVATRLLTAGLGGAGAVKAADSDEREPGHHVLGAAVFPAAFNAFCGLAEKGHLPLLLGVAARSYRLLCTPAGDDEARHRTWFLGMADGVPGAERDPHEAKLTADATAVYAIRLPWLPFLKFHPRREAHATASVRRGHTVGPGARREDDETLALVLLDSLLEASGLGRGRPFVLTAVAVQAGILPRITGFDAARRRVERLERGLDSALVRRARRNGVESPPELRPTRTPVGRSWRESVGAFVHEGVIF